MRTKNDNPTPPSKWRGVAITVCLLIFANLARYEACGGDVTVELASYNGNLFYPPHAMKLYQERFPRQSWERVDCLVVLRNTSGKALDIYEGWNGWGWFSLTFRLAMSGGQEIVVQRNGGAWSQNAPTTLRMPASGLHVFPVAFNENKWTNVAALKEAVRIKAVFEQQPLVDHPLAKFKALNIFTNRVESTWYPVREVLDEYFDTRNNYEGQIYP